MYGGRTIESITVCTMDMTSFKYEDRFACKEILNCRPVLQKDRFKILYLLHT